MEVLLLTIKLIALFCAGFVTDLLATKYTQSIANKKIWWATGLSGAISLVNYGLIAFLLTDSL